MTETNQKDTVGEIIINLKPIMQRRNISPYMLSKLTGIDKDTIYKYYNQQILYRIDLYNLAKICHVLRCNVTDIMIYKETDD